MKYLLIFVLCFLTKTTATNHFVDKNASGYNNGESWTNAWGSFADIDWASISPGDTLYISGGTTQKVYDEELTPTKSGTAGTYIVITKGKSSGHNGEVIIDRNGAAGYCVYADGAKYIVYNNLTLKNTTHNNMRMRSSNNIISNCKIYVSSGATAGIDLRASNCIIENNYIWTSSAGSGSGQRDGMQATTGGGHIIRYNTTIIYNTSENAHCDAWQFFGMESGCQIYGNYIFQDNTKTTNAQGIFIQDTDVGTWEIYNNVLNMPYAKKGIGIVQSQLDANIIGNTFYQSNSISPNFKIKDDRASSVTNIVIKNNIFYTTSSYSTSLVISETMGSGCEVDGNIHYGPNLSNPIYYNGFMSLSTWNSLSFVGSDIEGNPNFSNPSNEDFTLQAGSPGIDAGIDLGSPYNVDINGTTRPQGQAWDIGAYENISGPDIYPPKVIGAVLLDSVTLKLSFSEPLESSSAQNSNNYSITNGISVLSASVAGSQVILNTSAHTVGIYTVTVNNLVDLAGNLISPENNSADYEMIILPGPGFPVHLYGTTESEKTAYFNLTIPDGSPEFVTYHLIVFDADHGGGDPPEGHAFINGNGPIELFPGANQQNGDGETNEFEFIVPKSWWINGVNELKFVRLYSTGYNIDNAYVSTDIEEESNVPSEFVLGQNYPNPFNPSTKIKFTIPQYVVGEENSNSISTSLNVYDILGNDIATLVNEKLTPGEYEVEFNPASTNNDLASGVYIYQLRAGNFVQAKKMFLLK